jgi:type IV secretory pathway VirB2 component (pilin)
VGYIAKGIALGVVAILIGVAALTHDASKSTGLDGALKALADLPLGMFALVLVGIGLVAYGLYCFVRARRAHL